MTIAKLGAGTSLHALSRMDESFDDDTLRAAIVAMAKAGPTLTALQAVIATGELNAIVLPFDVLLESLEVWAGEWGSAGSTIVEVIDNVATLATVTVGNAVADESGVSTAIGVVVAAGTPIIINVDTAPTDGTRLIATVVMRVVNIEE